MYHQGIKNGRRLTEYERLNIKTKVNKKPSAREQTSKSYKECLNVVKTEDDINIINNALIEARGKIMAKNRICKDVDISRGEVSNFPDIESRRVEKSKAPPGSPSRYKR